METQAHLKREDVLTWFTNRQVFEDAHVLWTGDQAIAPLVRMISRLKSSTTLC